MNMEEIENKLDINRIVQAVGFMDMKHFEEFKLHAAMGLKKFGDHFATVLGEALEIASVEDGLKIVRYWHAMCDHYVLLYRMYLAKERAAQE